MQHGFGNHFETEALKGALPRGQNSPQKVAFGLYAEQHNGTAFTMARAENKYSWVYRIRPSVSHGEYKHYDQGKVVSSPLTGKFPPTQLRWNPLPFPTKATDFVDSLVTYCVNGNMAVQAGVGIHLYAATASMTDRYFSCSDGELLIVPESGDLEVRTEYGHFDLTPLEIGCVPRGVKFQVRLKGKKARGYVLENYGLPLRLPNLGPIGSNGLANPRDFEIPEAAYDSKDAKSEIVTKFGGHLWVAKIHHSPLDVVAWHGNLAPYKYDLRKYNVINTVSYDHPDPSIFTVLTSPSDTPGMANLDFAIFPPRWMVAEHTFRPPYYHRNVMSEFMGNIVGAYDAKEDGFAPGGASLHNCMAGHGPDADAFEKASEAELKPHRYKDMMAFMFESRYVYTPTEFAMKSGLLQRSYMKCWAGLKREFKGK